MKRISFPIENGHVVAFSRAVGADDDAMYSAAQQGDVLTAPPTFVQSSAQCDPDYPLRPDGHHPWFGSGSTPSGTIEPHAPKSAEDSKPSRAPSGSDGGSLHAEQRYVYHRPVRTGETLTVTSHEGNTWSKEGRRGGKLLFSENVVEYRDAAGELVVTATGVGVRPERVVDPAS